MYNDNFSNNRHKYNKNSFIIRVYRYSKTIQRAIPTVLHLSCQDFIIEDVIYCSLLT